MATEHDARRGVTEWLTTSERSTTPLFDSPTLGKAWRGPRHQMVKARGKLHAGRRSWGNRAMFAAYWKVIERKKGQWQKKGHRKKTQNVWHYFYDTLAPEAAVQLVAVEGKRPPCLPTETTDSAWLLVSRNGAKLHHLSPYRAISHLSATCALWQHMCSQVLSCHVCSQMCDVTWHTLMCQNRSDVGYFPVSTRKSVCAYISVLLTGLVMFAIPLTFGWTYQEIWPTMLGRLVAHSRNIW